MRGNLPGCKSDNWRETAFCAGKACGPLKAAGYNCIRSAHNPISKKLLDPCDRYGMYVMDEFTDIWTSSKTAFDYGIHITEWWEQDLSSMVNKDFNHPSVFMYSIGNEIPETGNKFNPQFGKKLVQMAGQMQSGPAGLLLERDYLGAEKQAVHCSLSARASRRKTQPVPVEYDRFRTKLELGRV